MSGFPRNEIKEMVDLWVAANDEAGETGDWSKMSSFCDGFRQHPSLEIQ